MVTWKLCSCLLEAGAHKNAKKEDGTTALFIASQKGHLEVVQCLLEAGADLYAAKRTGATALCAADSCC